VPSPPLRRRAMGYDVGRLPGFMKRYLYGSAPTQQ
jgi:hypothetical protein